MSKLPNTIQLKGVRNVTPSYQPKVWLQNKILKVEKSLKLRSHNIDGFNWGHDRKGALQLALAVCLEIYPEDFALEIYRAFQEEFLSAIHEDGFIITLNLSNFNERVRVAV